MTDSRYSVLKDGTLMIERTSERDVGVYECVAKNPMGQVKSRSARMESHQHNLGKYIFRENSMIKFFVLCRNYKNDGWGEKMKWGKVFLVMLHLVVMSQF